MSIKEQNRIKGLCNEQLFELCNECVCPPLTNSPSLLPNLPLFTPLLHFRSLLPPLTLQTPRESEWVSQEGSFQLNLNVPSSYCISKEQLAAAWTQDWTTHESVIWAPPLLPFYSTSVCLSIGHRPSFPFSSCQKPLPRCSTYLPELVYFKGVFEGISSCCCCSVFLEGGQSAK